MTQFSDRINQYNRQLNRHVFTQLTCLVIVMVIGGIVPKDAHWFWQICKLVVFGAVSVTAAEDHRKNHGLKGELEEIDLLLELQATEKAIKLEGIRDGLFLAAGSSVSADEMIQQAEEEREDLDDENDVPELLIAKPEAPVRRHSIRGTEPTCVREPATPNFAQREEAVLPSKFAPPVEVVAPKKYEPAEMFDWVELQDHTRHPHICVVGESGVGKTAMQEWIARFLASGHKLVVLTTKRKDTQWVDLNPIGLGRKHGFAQVRALWKELELELDNRCIDLTASEDLPHIVIAIDELNDLVSGADIDLKSIARAGREPGLRLVVNSHSVGVEALGMKGNQDIKECFTWIRLGKQAVRHAQQLVNKNIMSAADLDWLKSRKTKYAQCMVDDQIALTPDLRDGWQQRLLASVNPAPVDDHYDETNDTEEDMNGMMSAMPLNMLEMEDPLVTATMAVLRESSIRNAQLAEVQTRAFSQGKSASLGDVSETFDTLTQNYPKMFFLDNEDGSIGTHANLTNWE